MCGGLRIEVNVGVGWEIVEDDDDDDDDGGGDRLWVVVY